MSDFWKKVLEVMLPWLIDILNKLIDDYLGKGTKLAMHHRVKLDHFLQELARDTKSQRLQNVWRRNNKETKQMIQTYGTGK